MSIIKASPFTLIIPAHNEEAVIERCLKAALEGAPSEEAFELIVAANGCNDRTIDIARATAPWATVLDLPEGSKTKAINAANSIATCYPRIVLDADIECEYRSLAAIAQALQEPGAMTAAPAIRLELSHGNWAIRTYYSAWMKQPFAKSGRGGAGCYGISRAGLAHIGEFPAIIGDDAWIHSRFPDEQKRFVDRDANDQPVYSIVRPPGTAWQQVRVEARRMIGNEEVRRDHPSPHLGGLMQGGGVSALLKSGATPLELLVFCGVKLLVRWQTWRSKRRGTSTSWTRDLTSRQQ